MPHTQTLDTDLVERESGDNYFNFAKANELSHDLHVNTSNVSEAAFSVSPEMATIQLQFDL